MVASIRAVILRLRAKFLEAITYSGWTGPRRRLCVFHRPRACSRSMQTASVVEAAEVAFVEDTDDAEEAEAGGAGASVPSEAGCCSLRRSPSMSVLRALATARCSAPQVASRWATASAAPLMSSSPPPPMPWWLPPPLPPPPPLPTPPPTLTPPPLLPLRRRPAPEAKEQPRRITSAAASSSANVFASASA